MIATGLGSTRRFTFESAYSRIVSGDGTNDIVFSPASRLSISGVVVESSATANGAVVDRFVWFLNTKVQAMVLFVSEGNYFTINLDVTNTSRAARLTLAGTGSTGSFPSGGNFKVYELEGLSF